MSLKCQYFKSDPSLILDRISWDDLDARANGVFDLADQITHDPTVWATIGALKVYGRLAKREFNGARRTEKAPVKQTTSSLERDVTGKVHGDVPKEIPNNWTRQELEESAAELRESIKTRKTEQVIRGEEGRHRARIGQEEQLLRKIEKKLGGS